MNICFLQDLEPLEDVSHELVFEDEDEPPHSFSEEHEIELVETVFHLMDEYLNEHSCALADHDTLLEDIKEMFYVQLEDHLLENDYLEEDLDDLLESALDIYLTTFHDCPLSLQDDKDADSEESCDESQPEQTHESQEEQDDEENKRAIILAKIERLRQLPQPAQRTREWYEFRWNLITASNAWKAFESQSAINQLIYEKCQPLKDFEASVNEPPKAVNVTTTLHWGQKYEPLSVMYYEHTYQSKVEDFGCLQHPMHTFLGASPDGVVIESNTGRFGRMLEIKNIVNREITGIPKKEYWVQMQLQMEVCDLDDCDFLETKFEEYPDYATYLEDYDLDLPYTRTRDGKLKGMIVYFHTSTGSPHYEYMPLDLTNAENINAWKEATMAKYEAPPFNYMFMKFLYWKLEKVSCVLVQRSRDWFKKHVGQLAKVWKTIEEERVSGYEHRAPVRRAKRDPIARKEDSNDVCFLKVVKL